MELRGDYRRNDVGCQCGASPGSATAAKSSKCHDLDDVRRQLSKYSGDGRHIHSTCRFDGHFGVYRDVLPQHTRARGDRHRCGNRGWDNDDPCRAAKPCCELQVRRAEPDSRRILDQDNIKLSTVDGLCRRQWGADLGCRGPDDRLGDLVNLDRLDPRRGQRTPSGRPKHFLCDVRDSRNSLPDVAGL